jgi:hypothetical protein
MRRQFLNGAVLWGHTCSPRRPLVPGPHRQFDHEFATILGLVWMRMNSSQYTCVEVDWSGIELNSIQFHSNTCGLRWIHMIPNKASVHISLLLHSGLWWSRMDKQRWLGFILVLHQETRSTKNQVVAVLLPRTLCLSLYQAHDR